MAIEDIRDALVVRENGLMLLTNRHGDVPGDNESGFGLFAGDTRYLSRLEFACLQAPLVMLLSTAALGYASEQVYTNPRMVTADGDSISRETIEIRRSRQIRGYLFETVTITNYNTASVALDVQFRYGADFADIFEVRGAARKERGRTNPVVCSKNAVTFSYGSLDGRQLGCRIQFEPAPRSINAAGAQYRLHLGAGQQASIRAAVTINPTGAADRPFDLQADSRSARLRLATDYADWRDQSTSILTSNEIFNAVLDQSLNDIRTLSNRHGSGNGYVSAGTPWFDTLFGRDSLITSLQMLAFNPAVARNTLTALAARQGTGHDDWRDEQPGKIIHELRDGEMARCGEVPFGCYYGSIDSTPLFLIVAAEYWRWTADLPFLHRLQPHLLAALAWMRQWGDVDNDGYLEYQRQSDEGLLNQGWKDSADAVMHRDGRLAGSPIALIEVQAYAYAALGGAAELATALGIADVASTALGEARRLRRRFNRDFWIEAEQFYALALDGHKQRVESITSNPGHALFSGIVPPGRRAAVAKRLLAADMFSGWGVRTLSSESPRFNPMGYHIGSVWPHDNSLLAAGLKRAGRESELEELATALYDTARAMDYYRLPELFCGSPRTSQSQPVPYPVACRPQAWAAGTMPLILASLLGLRPDAARGELQIVRPRLPGWLDHVSVRNLRVGDQSVDLVFELKNRRTDVQVSKCGSLKVEVTQQWR